MNFKQLREKYRSKFPAELVAAAVKIALDMGGAMTPATKKIEAMKRGLSDDPIVKDALRLANESVKEAMSAADKKKRLDMIRKAVEKLNAKNDAQAKKDALAAIKAMESVNESAIGDKLMKSQSVRKTLGGNPMKFHQVGKPVVVHGIVDGYHEDYIYYTDGKYVLAQAGHKQVGDARNVNTDDTFQVSMVDSMSTSELKKFALTDAGQYMDKVLKVSDKVRDFSKEDEGQDIAPKQIKRVPFNESVKESAMDTRERKLNIKMKELEYKMKLADFIKDRVEGKIKPKQEKKKLPEADTSELKVSDTSSTTFNKLNKIAKDVGVEITRDENSLKIVGDAKKMGEFKSQMSVAMKESVSEEVETVLEKAYDSNDVKKVQQLEKKLQGMLKEVEKTMKGSGLSAPAFNNVRSGIQKGLESIQKFYKIASNTKKTFKEARMVKRRDVMSKHGNELKKALRSGSLDLSDKAEEDLINYVMDNYPEEISTDDPDDWIDWLDNNLEDFVKGKGYK